MIRTRANPALCGAVRKETRVNRDALVCRSSGDGRTRYRTRPTFKQFDTFGNGVPRCHRAGLRSHCHRRSRRPVLAHTGDVLHPEGSSSTRKRGVSFILGATR